jgi:hypothetical protein
MKSMKSIAEKLKKLETLNRARKADERKLKN